MENKKSIPLIIVVSFLIGILLVFDNIELAYAEVIHYSVTANQAGEVQCNAGSSSTTFRFVGEEVIAGSALIGDTINKITFYIAKFDENSSMGGEAIIGIWDSTVAPTSTNYIRLISVIPVSAIPNVTGGGTLFNRTFADYTVTANTMIGMFANVNDGGVCNVNDWISLRQSTSDQFDGVNTRLTKYSNSGVFTDDTTRDMTYFLVNSEIVAEEVCIDINDSPNQTTLVCYEDLDGDGVPDLPGGFFGGVAQRNVTSSAQFLAENLGLVEEGSDIRFNGVGYMIVAVGLGILIAMFFLASSGDLNRIPTFVWFIGVLAVMGALTGFGFVDVTFFIIGILVIIALASAKILSTLELGGFR